MDKKLTLAVALTNIQSTIDLLNQVPDINGNILPILNSAKIELENLNSDKSDAYFDYTRNDPNRPNPFTKPEDIERANRVVGKENTYTVQEDSTEGWTTYEDQTKQSTHLTKDKAKRLIDELINDGISPDRLRVVVDGTV
tara:strand:- start:232 stop:651 length:420 start_codon:yes stop_codon:yes gene_type:complete